MREEAAAAGWLKLQRMSDDRQLWLCVSGQRLLLLIACYFEGNHQSFPLGLWGERQQAAELRGRSLWPAVHLPSYSSGPKQDGSLIKTLA